MLVKNEVDRVSGAKVIIRQAKTSPPGSARENGFSQILFAPGILK